MSHPMSLVISNCPPGEAERLAQALVEGRLAACVTLSPVKSVYIWQGEVCVDQEVTLTAKVSEAGVEACVARLLELHPYELPEVLCVPVDHARSHEPYCEWVRQACRDPTGG